MVELVNIATRPWINEGPVEVVKVEVCPGMADLWWRSAAKAEESVSDVEERCVYEKWKALVFERCGGGVGARDWSRMDVWDKQVPDPTCQATSKYHTLRDKRDFSRMQPCRVVSKCVGLFPCVQLQINQGKKKCGQRRTTLANCKLLDRRFSIGIECLVLKRKSGCVEMLNVQ